MYTAVTYVIYNWLDLSDERNIKNHSFNFVIKIIRVLYVTVSDNKKELKDQS